MRVAQLKEIDRLEHSLATLATVGSTSPYVGLFGTVWGIMSAFSSLGNVQQATLAMVAPGISEALITTAIGLFAAIPAVVAYNRYADQVRRLEMRYDAFMEEFSTILQRHAGRGRSSLRQRRSAELMAQQPTRGKRRLMGEINVVPYIDVMLVLLIIFMITAPLLTQGIKVDLPKAAAEPHRRLQRNKPAGAVRRSGRTAVSERGRRSASGRSMRRRWPSRAAAALRREPGRAGAGQGRQRGQLRTRRAGHGDAAAGRRAQGRLHDRSAAAAPHRGN